MQQINKYNRDYISLEDDYGRVNAFQLIFYATSGHGKGLAQEGLVEEWKNTTSGIVIVLADPKDEAEFSFVNFKPKEKYHLNRLKADGINPKSYEAKLYHPYTHNIPKSHLPEINFYTFSIKDMKREDWAILSESKQDSATIRLLTRGSSELGKEQGLFRFLHNIEKMSEGKKRGKTSVEDPKNFYLRKASGNAKSVVEISSMIAGFRENYFLRKDTCKYKINWEEILRDSDSYHVFLSMWLEDLKLQEFCVLHLLNSAVSEIQRLSNKGILKKPVLFVVPEIKRLCPDRPEGYKEFLSEAFGDAIDTIRSKGRSISFIGDSQSWSGTDVRVRNAGETFFGKLSAKDKDLTGKACSYNKDKKDMLGYLSNKNMKCCFLRFEHEDDGIYRFFLPSHMHKEESYNWIETYKAHNKCNSKYNQIKKEMREEYKSEEEDIKILVQKRKEEIEKYEKQKKQEKEDKKNKDTKEKKPIERFIVTPEIERKLYKMWKIDLISLREIEEKLKDDPLINVKPSIATIRKYAKSFEELLQKSEKSFDEFEYGKPIIKNMIGDGISKEEFL